MISASKTHDAMLMAGTQITFTGTAQQMSDDASLMLDSAMEMIGVLQDGMREPGSQIGANPEACASALYGALALIGLAKALVDYTRPRREHIEETPPPVARTEGNVR